MPDEPSVARAGRAAEEPNGPDRAANPAGAGQPTGLDGSGPEGPGASPAGIRRPEALPGPDPEAVLRYIERFASLLIAAGTPPMPARVFAALLTTDSGRMTAAELSGTLLVSRAAISDGVRYLTQIGLVDREREPGSRRDHYRMPDDVWVKMITLQDQTFVRWSNLLREGIGLVGAGTRAAARMAEQAAYFDFISKEIPGMLQRWEEYKTTLPGGGPHDRGGFSAIARKSHHAPGGSA